MEEEERLRKKIRHGYTRQVLRSDSFTFPRIAVLLIILQNLVLSCVCETIQAPRFIVQPSSASSIVNEGITKILQCQAIANPVPVYKWLKNGRELTDFSPEQYYKIESVRREDAGSYQCVAKNDVGSVLSQKIDVTVAYMGKFLDVSEKMVTAESGQAAILELPYIESFPEPLVTWQTGNTSIISSKLDVITISRQLIILSVSDAHQKSYRARVTNTHLGRDEFSPYITLIVRNDHSARDVLPKIIVRPRDLSLIKGDQSSDLHCYTNAKPLYVLETLWYKDGIPIDNTGITYHSHDPWNRTLSLFNANLTFTGKYKCVVSLRNVTVEAEAQVTVLEAPIFTSSIRQETLGEYGAVVKLPCEAIAIPVPNITWYKNAVEISKLAEHNRYHMEEGGTLVIKKLSIEDSGLFQCVASNEAGSDSLVTWLKVKGWEKFSLH